MFLLKGEYHPLPSHFQAIRVGLWTPEVYDGWAPKWRNWQTRRTQNPVPSGECGFDSHLRHSRSVVPPHGSRLSAAQPPHGLGGLPGDTKAVSNGGQADPPKGTTRAHVRARLPPRAGTRARDRRI